MAIFLSEEHVRETVGMPLAIEVLEQAFQKLAEGKAENVPRRRTKAPGMMLHSMSAAAEYLGYVGWKVYTTTRSGAQFFIGLSHIDSGEMVALIQANILGQLRTGAASGVATRHLARSDSRTVGIFGTGFQARTQLEAVCAVRDIEQIDVYGRNQERKQSFAATMREICQCEVVPVPHPEEVAAEKDIVITATTSKTPLFDGKQLRRGTHLNVVGSNHLAKTEIDVSTVKRSQRIVCDSIEACQIEAGDFSAALEQGVTDWRSMHNLGDVVAGHTPGRESPDEITLFKSVGLAIEDVALGVKVLELARERNLGQELPF